MNFARRKFLRYGILGTSSLILLYYGFNQIIQRSINTRLPNTNNPKTNGSDQVKVGDKTYRFDPANVKTVRPDLIQPGQKSLFDVLVHLGLQGQIQLEYHFDSSMNTYVIDSINGAPNWWYRAYYDGGWQESNVFRMGHYPWKENTTLQVRKEDPSQLDTIYSIFREELTRRINNDGKIVIPQVIIQTPEYQKVFDNVEVTPHNMRMDLFQENVITALDAILSLVDQGHFTHVLM